MRKHIVAVAALALAGCGPSTIAALDASDDLHCAFVAQTIEAFSKTQDVSLLQRKGLYALTTWYFTKVPKSRLSEHSLLVAAAKREPGRIVEVGRRCADRALGDPEFGRWAEFAGKEYGEGRKR